MNALRDWRIRTLLLVVVGVTCGYLVVTAMSLAYVVAGIVVLVACAVFFKPRELLLVAALLVPLFGAVNGALGSFVVGNMSPADVALAVFTLSAFVRPSIRDIQGPVWVLFSTLACIFLGVALASTFLNSFLALGLVRVGRIAMVGVCVLGAARALTWSDAERATMALVFSTAGVSFLGAIYTILHFAVRSPEMTDELPRLWGQLIDPNYNAVLIAMTLVIAVSWLPDGGLRNWWRLSAVVLAIALVMTLSRGGLIAAAAGLATVGTVIWIGRRTGQSMPSPRTIITVAVVLAVFTGALYLFAPDVLDRGTTRFAGMENVQTDATGVVRLRIWDAATEMFQRSPIFGVGPGAASHAMMSAGLFPRLFEVHNSFLELLVETGILGFVPLALLLLVGVFSGATQALSARAGSQQERLRTVGLTGALVAGIVGAASLSGVLFSAGLALVAAILAVVCSDLLCNVTEESKP